MSECSPFNIKIIFLYSHLSILTHPSLMANCYLTINAFHIPNLQNISALASSTLKLLHCASWLSLVYLQCAKNIYITSTVGQNNFRIILFYNKVFNALCNLLNTWNQKTQAIQYTIGCWLFTLMITWLTRSYIQHWVGEDSTTYG
jgi:hypothetical protein